jgi:hypothetical protein
MSRHDRYLLGLFLARWGFAAMVAAAILVGLAVAVTVTPPADLPSVALGASPVFRVEVGAAVFLSLYLATMAFVLALHNRGFTEIGTGGVRARDLAEMSDDTAANHAWDELIADLVDEVTEVQRRGGRVVD